MSQSRFGPGRKLARSPGFRGRFWIGALLLAALTLGGSASARAAGEWSAPRPVDPAILTNSVSCASPSFCVSVGGASTHGSAAVYSAGTWSEASLIDPQAGLLSVSCPSSSFCMAMDGGGRALTYNGSAWSEPLPTGGSLFHVSCVSASFCAAVGAEYAATYRDGQWSEPVHVSAGGLDSVSCSSETFCMAIDPGGGGGAIETTYDGSTWSTPTEFDSQPDSALQSLSCVSASFCVAAGNFGDELTYDGSTWSKEQIGHSGIIDSVSCRSESFCAALTPTGETILFNGSTWSNSTTVGERAARVVSCPSDSFCIAAGDYASAYNGTTWSDPTPIGSAGIGSVSCPDSSFCMAVDHHGRALSYDGSAWSHPIAVDPEGGLASVSCPASTFCVAVGGRARGYALTYDGSSWSPPSEVDSAGELDSVSCVSASFCVALSEHQSHTYALIYDGGGWSAPREIDQAALRSVSCVSPSMCVAVGEHDALIYRNGPWTGPDPIYPEGGLWGVSCASSSFCAAVSERLTGVSGQNTGQALTYDGSVWSAPIEIAHAQERGPFSAGSVSCASAAFCVAIARFEGAVSIFEGSGWGAWVPLETNGDFSSVSCPSRSFCMLGDEAGQVLAYSAPAAGEIPGHPGQESQVDRNQASREAPDSPGPAGGPAVERRKPRVNGRTGEIVLDYEFPEPGNVQVRAEVLKEATLARVARRHLDPSEQRSSPAPRRTVRLPVYGESATWLDAAGRYTLRVKPRNKIRAALKQGESLTVRLTVRFEPAGTSEEIDNSASVEVR